MKPEMSGLMSPKRRAKAGAPHHRADADPARAVVAVGDGGAVLSEVVDLVAPLVDDGVAADRLAVVEAGLGDGRLALGRDVLDQEVGLAVGGDRVGGRQDGAVPVGEREVPVLPRVGGRLSGFSSRADRTIWVCSPSIT